ncbi:MAG: dihydrofolate synthase / folylpolyglutamate synthase [Patescibacteria group bacterium]|nr:dihydrofolate synthase / folylpolyglutamate synthase [Patescibacteria group bacterium]
MKITPFKTPIVHKDDDLLRIISNTIKSAPEKSILVVTSKVVALSEGAVAKKVTGEKTEKWEIVKQQAELYTEPNDSEYQLMLTIKDQVLAVNAGLDESNADGEYVLLPQDSFVSAQRIWEFVRQQYQVSKVGVLITDSRTFPLKWGVIGTALAHCGFKALNNRIGEADLFGHQMQMTQENIAESLAVAGNVVMGEVAECQPLALIEDVPMVEFTDKPPSVEERSALQIDLKDDAYAPILLKADWKKGGSHRS